MPKYTGSNPTRRDIYNHLQENHVSCMIKRVGSEFTDEGTEEELEGEMQLASHAFT